MSKICIIGDLHLKDSLSYSEYFSDKREKEKKEILDYIVMVSSECDKVVTLGDNFHKHDNTSKTIKEFVEFLERFTVPVVVIAGNHEKSSDGKSALDFLKEVKGKHWTIVTDVVYSTHSNENIIFCPYFFYSELSTSNKEDASKEVLSRIFQSISLNKNKKNYLFIHHAISDVLDYGGINTNQYNEVVIDRKDLKQFERAFGGHIHWPSEKDNIIIAGSVFANKVGDEKKYVYILDTETNKVEKKLLPGRQIIKIDYTTKEDLSKIDYPAIIKVHAKTDEQVDELESLKKTLSDKDQVLIIIKDAADRQTLNVSATNNILDLPLEALLELYAEKRGIPSEKLLQALSLVN